MTLKEILYNAQKAALWDALCRHAHNRTAAGKELGLDSRWLGQLIKRHNLQSPIPERYRNNHKNFGGKDYGSQRGTGVTRVVTR